MTTHRLSLLREEYETTTITIDELCLYHGTLLKELKGYKSWKKIAQTEPTLDIAGFLEDESQPEISTTAMGAHLSSASEPVIEEVASLPATTPPVTPPVPTQTLDIAQLKLDIGTCKQLAITRCKDFLTNDAKFAEIKEIKDVVAIVSDIDKSIAGTPQGGTTVNVLINNLIASFRDDV